MNAPPRRTRHQRAERSGRAGERWAKWWLRARGWQILGQRVRVPAGEVDLIARRGQMILFVEVKTRAPDVALGDAFPLWRQQRVVAAATALWPRYRRDGDDMRIDALIVQARRFSVPRITHIPNFALDVRP